MEDDCLLRDRKPGGVSGGVAAVSRQAHVHLEKI